MAELTTISVEQEGRRGDLHEPERGEGQIGLPCT